MQNHGFTSHLPLQTVMYPTFIWETPPSPKTKSEAGETRLAFHSLSVVQRLKLQLYVRRFQPLRGDGAAVLALGHQGVEGGQNRLEFAAVDGHGFAQGLPVIDRAAGAAADVKAGQHLLNLGVDGDHITHPHLGSNPQVALQFEDLKFEGGQLFFGRFLHLLQA